MTKRELRESIQTYLSTITGLPDVVCLLERDGTDQSEAEAEALRTKGMLLVVQNALGALGAQSQEGQLLKLDLAIPIALIENPVVNLNTGGTTVPGEDAIDIVAKKIMGRRVRGGSLVVLGDSFGRIDEGDGVIVHFFVVAAPWLMQSDWEG